MKERKYIESFLSVVRQSSMENTYKTAWAKAIVEVCNDHYMNNNNTPNTVIFDLEQIAWKVYKYYWNQIFFFGMEDNFLIHSQNPNKKPEIVTLVKNDILLYCQERGNKPEFFEKLPDFFLSKVKISKVISTLKKDVSWRFLNLKYEEVPLYQYNPKGNTLTVPHLDYIFNYTDILLESINYRWSSVLEKFNPGLPNVCGKVRLQNDLEIRRSNLKKFIPRLKLQNPNLICSICDKKIEDEKQISVDHVIPWSYLYSDDLWNFLIAHKGCNSSKSNIIPAEDMIVKLEKKNSELLNQLEKEGKKNKEKFMLEYAIKHNYVRKFWNMSRGF
jgi:hypothetical protein